MTLAAERPVSRTVLIADPRRRLRPPPAVGPIAPWRCDARPNSPDAARGMVGAVDCGADRRGGRETGSRLPVRADVCATVLRGWPRVSFARSETGRAAHDGSRLLDESTAAVQGAVTAQEPTV